MKDSFFYGSPQGLSYDMILDVFSGTQLNSLRTSTVPLVQFWKKASDRIKAIESKLDLSLRNAVYCFEYPTAPKGRGKSSMTDLMILGEGFKIAIEAKFTEYHKGKDLLISQWMSAGNKENREIVVKGWYDIIKSFVKVEISDLNNISYQFLHRTASACFNSHFAYIVYLVFYDGITKASLVKYREELKAYVDILRPDSNLAFYIWEVEIEQTLHEGIDIRNCFTKMKSLDIYSFYDDKLYCLG